MKKNVKSFYLKHYFTQNLDRSRRILSGQELEKLMNFSEFPFFFNQIVIYLGTMLLFRKKELTNGTRS